jgi:hypothetical protein
MFEIVPNRKIIIDMDAFTLRTIDNPSCEVNLSLWVVLKTGALQQRVMRPGNLVL